MKQNPIELLVNDIINRLESGEAPKALANKWLSITPVPMHDWSISNQCIALMQGTVDARGYKAWQQVGRQVKKGCHAIRIIAPMPVKKKDGKSDDDVVMLFRAVNVFRYEDTEGEPLHHEANEHINSLPWLDVADEWDITVLAGATKVTGSCGVYSYGGMGKRITLGVENLSTWAHELVHAAEDRLGKLKDSGHTEAEVVAELGGAVLLSLAGKNEEADIGGCIKYINAHNDGKPNKTIKCIQRVMTRMVEAVDLILTTEAKLQEINNAA